MSPREQWFHVALLAHGPPVRSRPLGRAKAEMALLTLLDAVAPDREFFYAAVGRAPTQTDDPLRTGLLYVEEAREQLEFDAWMHLRNCYDDYTNWYGREELRWTRQRAAAKALA